ncbi:MULTISPECIES: GDP-L-fucose synthase family protein [unclassified Lebetimonas]|uniref:GDP-L-fucose synthase family protein n=1 Tax=unclassified Lebetimonas TaxID=2648158 RepID=UPI0004663210|nr:MULTISPECIES: GDP-L-fucose synthase [unclassified Lebetimonas]
MNKNSKIYVAGGTGLVGSAIIKKLLEKGYKNVISTYRNRQPLNDKVKWIKLDLLNQNDVEEFLKNEKPEYVFLAAAKVGGIIANNTYRADFIYENLQIQNNVIYNAYKYEVKKLMFLGSTCIYPKNCPQPIKEEYLLTGELEYTNEPYAIAKIAGIKMCESFNLQYGTNFISVMPTNLYGENDNFDLEKSHVLPALIRKIHLGKCLENGDWEGIRKDLNGTKVVIGNSLLVIGEKSSKEDLLKVLNHFGIQYTNTPITNNQSTKPKVLIEIWGSGKPMREFLYSDDMADACVFLMENVDFKDIVDGYISNSYIGENKQITNNQYTNIPITNTHINIGTGKDISIKDLAYLIKDIIGFQGDFYFNTEKPDGTMRKVTDVSKLHSLGWQYKTTLKEGIEKVYRWYVEMSEQRVENNLPTTDYLLHAKIRKFMNGIRIYHDR